MLRPLRTTALLIAATVAVAACQSEPETAPAETTVADTTAAPKPRDVTAAAATLVPLGESGVLGEVAFRRLGDATEVRYTIDGLSPGEHGFHVHKNADCSADSTGAPGSAAGPHLNPLASPHGAPTGPITGHHAGDMGNVLADASGHAEGILVDSVLAFRGPASLLGHAVIVHAGRDDLETDPGGNSGARVACGVTDVRSDPVRAPTDSTALAR